MRIQYLILMFILSFNLATALVIALQLPGTEYINPQSPSVSTASDYETTFNATEIATGWQASPFSGIPVIGDIFSAFQFLWRSISFLIDGFPQMLDWIGGTFVLDASGLAAFEAIKWTWRALFAVTMSFFVLEYISGRNASD